MKPTILLAAVLAAATAQAQDIRPTTPMARPFRYVDEPNAARIGIYLGENTSRDTAGVLVNSVIKDSPAEKAGLKEGDRIAAIDGVNLKMSRDDIGDAAMSGMMTRRLTRELDKHKPGDDVELRVTSGDNSRTVRIKTVSARDLDTAPAKTVSPTWSTFGNDRAALGIGLGGSPSKRDTLGVFVASVNADGPAEKAGIVEGDRIARINSVDLRVQGPEAGDADMTRALISRLNREIGKLKAGDAVTLTVVTGGRSREVKLTAAKASELHGANSFFFGDGMHIEMPQLDHLRNIGPGVYSFPRGDDVRSFTIPGGKFYQFDGGKVRVDVDQEVKEKIEKAMEKARESIEKSRSSIKTMRSDDAIRSKIKVPARVRIVTES